MTTKPENLTANDFFRFDLRVGTILSIEEVPKSKKLLKMEVSFGPLGNRTILAGLGPRIKPDDTTPGTYVEVGQKVIAVLNLESRTMMGIESRGMLLAAPDMFGKPQLISPLRLCTAPDGGEVG